MSQKFTNTSEAGLEKLIVKSLTEEAGYREGSAHNYLRENAVDIEMLKEFLWNTQPEIAERLDLDNDSTVRRKFLNRLQGEITKRGVVDVLRKGINHEAHSITNFYASPTAKNVKAREMNRQNIFSVTRQLKYNVSTQQALDLCIFINGLPVATFELKNLLTKQNYFDAIEQYKNDRDPREILFQFGRCLVHFAVDDSQVYMCTHLQGKSSWFLPFNKGHNFGGGNPPNPHGIKTDYLWKEILTKDRLTDIIENYAQILEEKDKHTGKKKRKQIFPRYHQLTVVRKLLADVQKTGVGKRYLIQHSAGSGKSNSIAWLAHQLVGLEKDEKVIFDSIIVVTDRRILDKQINNTIKSFTKLGNIIGHAERSGDLRKFIKEEKQIIISTVQKFPFILSEIGDEHRHNKFAIIIDEAHSSQGGKASSKMNIALAEPKFTYDAGNEEKDLEDVINDLIEKKKMLTNASYFAFTATPKNKTLEVFGYKAEQADGTVKHYPFHNYSMRQAIDEGFILDVLQNYVTYKSYYQLIKKYQNDPEFETKKAKKKFREYVESDKHSIKDKAGIMMEHFYEQVYIPRKINGKARAMVVTKRIKRAIDYYYAIRDVIKERNYPFEPIVAFSGEAEYGEVKVSETSLNDFPSNEIVKKIKEDPYRILVVADKYQTGYDEPLMHTMYVDKPLSGIKAVQTLSRLNRSHPSKKDTFVLDFCNKIETIKESFQDYYQTTILSDSTNPNKLHDLQSILDSMDVYEESDCEKLVELFIKGAERDTLDPILDICVHRYMELEEDQQVEFKGSAKSFVKTYGFLSSILTFNNIVWEKRSIFYNLLIPKLPAPKEEDLAKGILEMIDLDSYRTEVKEEIKRIELESEDSEIDPVPPSGGYGKPDPEFDFLSNIVKTFNDLFGNIEWTDKDKIRQVITEELPQRVSADVAYQNAIKNSDAQNARIEHDKALEKVIASIFAAHNELYKQFYDNPSFRKWLGDSIFNQTYQRTG